MDHGPQAGPAQRLQPRRNPLRRRITTFALSLCSAVLLAVAVSRLPSEDVTGYDFSGLKNALDVAIVTSVLFALSAVHMARGPRTGRRVWPILGAFASGVTVLLILVFGLNFIYCFGNCFPPVPSLIELAMALNVLCIGLGINGAAEAGDDV